MNVGDVIDCLRCKAPGYVRKASNTDGDSVFVVEWSPDTPHYFREEWSFVSPPPYCGRCWEKIRSPSPGLVGGDVTGTVYPLRWYPRGRRR